MSKLPPAVITTLSLDLREKKAKYLEAVRDVQDVKRTLEQAVQKEDHYLGEMREIALFLDKNMDGKNTSACNKYIELVEQWVEDAKDGD